MHSLSENCSVSEEDFYKNLSKIAEEQNKDDETVCIVIYTWWLLFIHNYRHAYDNITLKYSLIIYGKKEQN